MSDYDPKIDFYELLQITEDSTTDTILKAHKRLAKENHPDLHGGCALKTRFLQQLNAARDTLTDSSKRQKYDAQRLLHRFLHRKGKSNARSAQRDRRPPNRPRQQQQQQQQRDANRSGRYTSPPKASYPQPRSPGPFEVLLKKQVDKNLSEKKPLSAFMLMLLGISADNALDAWLRSRR